MPQNEQHERLLDRSVEINAQIVPTESILIRKRYLSKLDTETVSVKHFREAVGYMDRVQLNPSMSSTGELPPQTDPSNGLWNVEDPNVKTRVQSSSPPLQGSDRSATSSTNSPSVSWNNGGSSIEVSDESSSSPSPNGVALQLPVGDGNTTTSMSWMNNAETCHEEDRAAFDRVVGDAPQRAHIRLKSRHHRGSKGDKASDASSDSSSYNHDSPPNVLNLSNIGDGKQQDGNGESEGSSGSGMFFRPTQSATKHLVKHGKTKGDVSQSDQGIAACTCGSSTSQQSSMSVSRDSGVGDSGVVTRKSVSKRSLASHYQTIKRGELDAETSHSSTVHNFRTVSDADTDRDRKRRRFNRTFAALRQCGLLDLTLQTATLMEQSQRMQKQLDTLRKETKILHGAMMQFSDVQPNFLQTNNAQQVMNNLEQIAKGNNDNSVRMLLEDTNNTTTQLLTGALNIQKQMMAAQGQGIDHGCPAPKKLKQKHSASSSQTLTSTSSPTTDSDELQKV